MASKALSNPLTRFITKKSFATAPKPSSLQEPKIASSVLPNQTFIAALNNGSPVTRVTIAFKAGSRYEPMSELGIAHVLRASAGLSTAGSSGFILARKLAQVGASVSASGDREILYYTLETTQDKLPEALECLKNMISQQEFRPWELSDNQPKLRYDVAILSPQLRAVDLMHKAAFRRGLGNSLFISPKRISSISSESLLHFASSTMSANRMAVAVVGDNLDKAALIVKALKLQSGSAEAASENTKYYGGDIRKEMGGELAHVAIALNAAPAGTPQSLAFAVASKALGSGPVTKWGADNSVLAKAIGNIGPFAAAGFNVSYSDAGLFGAVLSVPKDEANSAVRAVVKALQNPNLLKERDIMVAKALLKTQILAEAENGTSVAESVVAQGLYSGAARTAIELAQDVDNVSDGAVREVLATASKSRPSIGAVGNLAFVPYFDEL